MKVFLFALLAALGNALFVYGQRSSQTSENPFVFLLMTLTFCTSLFLLSALFAKAPIESAYIWGNLKYIVCSAIGFFVTFIGFYWLYTEQGAINYIVYALLSILTTSIGVGIVLFGEPFNRYHIISGALAVAAILVYGLAQHKLTT